MRKSLLRYYRISSSDSVDITGVPLVKTSLEKIVDEVLNEFREAKLGSQKSADCLLQALSIDDAMGSLVGKHRIRRFRFAKIEECAEAEVPFFFYYASDRNSALIWCFYETFGVRLTLMLNLKSRIGTVLSFQRLRLSENHYSTKGCLRAAYEIYKRLDGEMNVD